MVYKPQTCRAVLAVDDDVATRLSDAAVASGVAPLGAPGRRRRAAHNVAPARAPVAAAVARVLARAAAPDDHDHPVAPNPVPNIDPSPHPYSMFYQARRRLNILAPALTPTRRALQHQMRAPALTTSVSVPLDLSKLGLLSDDSFASVVRTPHTLTLTLTHTLTLTLTRARTPDYQAGSQAFSAREGPMQVT